LRQKRRQQKELTLDNSSLKKPEKGQGKRKSKLQLLPLTFPNYSPKAVFKKRNKVYLQVSFGEEYEANDWKFGFGNNLDIAFWQRGLFNKLKGVKQSLSFIFKALPLTIYGLFLLFASSAEAQAADIRVSGFNSSRNPAPLTGFTPNVYFEEDYAASLRNTLLDESNFGPGGTISCSVNFQPFVSSVVRGSLVSGGQKRSEVFFAGISNRELAGDEASELADFIRAGGIVYVSAEAYSAYQGLGIPGFEGTKFNPLFSSLGISDSFPQGEVIDFHPCGTTSTPIGTPVTTGPFGIIDPIGHSIFNPINTSTLQSIATGFNELCFIGFSLEEEGVISPLAAESGQYDRTILAEGQLGQGYLAVSGEALYTYSEYDENIRNYFLNLFALACPGGADQPPVPFLDLPWDYQGKGLSFSEAATAIGSYFDHEYPFSDVGSVLGEPLEAKGSVLSFQGPPRDLTLNYSNHDGYDWLGPARVHNDDPVLAAASGTATFYKADKNNTACGTWACGNVIVVDHGNGYQTRYYHLQDNDPISQSFTTPRFVNGGEVIGKVGSTGKSTAPHIHFSVIQDKDQDGDFNDDRPDGLTDPFGWQSEEEDPWPNYSFTYKGVERTGNKSHYLWTNPIANLSSELTSNGGYFRLERYELNFPQDATADPLTVEVQYSPSVTISDSFESLGSGLYLNVIDATGNPITTFPQEFTLTIDFSDFDISKYKISSISIYSSGNGVDWAKEETDVDFANSVAFGQLMTVLFIIAFALVFLASKMGNRSPRKSGKR